MFHDEITNIPGVSKKFFQTDVILDTRFVKDLFDEFFQTGVDTQGTIVWKTHQRKKNVSNNRLPSRSRGS